MMIQGQQRLYRRAVAVALLATGVLWAAGGLINSIPFELDGNATKNGANDDWQSLLTSPGSSKAFTGVAFDPSSFSGGNTVTDPSTFIQGAKDTDDVSGWHSGPGGIPPKDDIVNAYAAAYQQNGHLIIAFGADRFANNGAAQLGFWFFQGQVSPPPANTNGLFTGTHQIGDILALINFTQGGGVPEIAVYRWIGGKNPLELINASTGQCGDAGATDACAITNTSQAVSLYWPSAFKFPVPNGTCTDAGNVACAPTVSFFEGAMDVTALVGNTPCFTSFMAETRSSPSLTATLEDYVLHSFNVCGVSIAKACAGSGQVNTGGTSIRYKFDSTAQPTTVANTGFGSLFHVTIIDSLPAGATNVVFKAGTPAVPPAVPGAATTVVAAAACPSQGFPAGSTCADVGTLGGGAVMNWSVEFDSTSTNVQNSATVRADIDANTSPGSCSTSGTVCATAGAQDSCSTAPSNSITVSKSCGVPTGFPNAVLPGTQLVTAGGFAAVQVNFSGQICNSGQTQLSGMTLTDNPGATFTLASSGPLAPGGCVKYSGSYKPTGVTLNDLGSSPGRYSFADEVKVTGATAAIGASPGHDGNCTSGFASNAQACASATCNICPAGAQCSGN